MLTTLVSAVSGQLNPDVNLVDTLWAADAAGLTPWPVAARGRNS